MPYRRLPNTDSARIKALTTAVEKAANTDFRDLSITPETLDEAKQVLTHFERLSNRYRQLFDIQVKAGQSFSKTARNARLYVSHFIQILYMCVMRSEINEKYLPLYGLNGNNMIVPDLSSYEQLLHWGGKIIKGEHQRITQNGVPIYNPSIAKVNVMFTLFKEGYQTHKLHQKATANISRDVAAYRKKVDKVIFDIWEEVENHNAGHPPAKRIAKNREYGIVYYYRKGETVE